MKRLLITAFAFALLFSPILRAEEAEHKPDDRVMFDVSAEDWVTTKTAHVVVSVEAAVTAATAGSTRSEMTKIVNSLAKTDWRLTSFDRNQDQAGMEHWSAAFEARLPESDLGGLSESAKKLSKAGLQLSIANIDFSPTLEETEAIRASLRAQIYKIANDQLATLNTALPGRAYRIALINFTGDDGMVPMPRVMKGRAAMMGMATVMASPEAAPQQSQMERAEKISLSARVVCATAPESKSLPPSSPPAPPLPPAK